MLQATVNNNVTHEQINQISEQIKTHSEPFRRLLGEVGRVIVGQEQLMHRMLVALLGNGHLLIEGVPGLAKTTAVSCLAKGINTGFQRLQFTPDLLPADLIGTLIYRPQDQDFVVQKGPIFSNLILADEINRAPAKVQSALLEAMQERQVTIGGETHLLDDPFIVMATQNPVEQEGTYPLPEAQQDRFMFKVFVDYPNFNEEFEVVRRTTTTMTDSITPVLTAEEILELQAIVRQVPVADHVIRYALALVRQTRVREAGVPDFVRDQLSWGAGPRAVQFLILGGKARALLEGRSHVACEDVQTLAKPVLRHRLVLNFTAESEGVTPDDLIERIVDITPTREDELTRDARFQEIFAS